MPGLRFHLFGPSFPQSRWSVCKLLSNIRSHILTCTHIARHGKGMFALFVKNRHINKMELTYTPIEGDGPEV